MIDIAMPRLSDSMELGTVLTWLKQDGEHVQRGDELVEIETDKATMTYESPETGTLTILAEQGATVPVGALLARLAEAGGEEHAAERARRTARGAESRQPAPETNGSDGAPVPKHAGAGTRATAAPTTSQAAGMTARTAGTTSQTAGTTAQTAGMTARTAGMTAQAAPPRVKATPLARRIAGIHDLDLTAVAGTGLGGRITRADVDALLGGVQRATPTPDGDRPAPTRAGPSAEARVVELSRLQHTVAKRMAQATSTIPHFQVQTEVLMDRAIALRAELKEITDAAPSINDLVVKACALALLDHPRANGSYVDGTFELHARINVGIAVATEDALIVPTIFDADATSLGAIAVQARRLSERVRNGTITPPELSGGTFTVSNLGMYGMTAITPVINPPQAAILGVGATRPVPALAGGELIEHQQMTLTLSCDHRILYGADAARFLAQIRELLEQPLRWQDQAGVPPQELPLPPDVELDHEQGRPQ